LSRWEDFESNLEPSTSNAKIPATFRRQLKDDNDKIDFEEVEIHSRDMKTLLIEASVDWEAVVTGSDQSFTVSSPFYQFVEHWDEHEESCKPNDTDNEVMKQTRVDLHDLLGLIKNSERLKSYFRSRDTIKSKRRIKFEFLWTIFGHRKLVYAKTYMNQMQMLEVKACLIPPYGKTFTVWCSGFDWNGSKFVAYTYEFDIREYENDVPIDSLDVFPVQYQEGRGTEPDSEQLQKTLLERGLKFVNLCTQEPANFQCHYEGTAYVAPSVLHRTTGQRRNPDARLDQAESRRTSNSQPEFNLTPIELAGDQSQVIVDSFSFLQSEQNTMKLNKMPPLGTKIPYPAKDCTCPVCRTSIIQQWISDRTLEPSESWKKFARDNTRLQLLPPRLLGLALKDKVWGQFLVDNLTKIAPKDDENREGPFWVDLELEKESKELLWVFMQQHKVTTTLKLVNKTGSNSSGVFDPSSKSIDIIEGKGQGLVILLHGPPGVGKTLTAETIALTTGRPLLTVSVSEIGLTAHDAEKALIPVFADAARWGAVLLMDEADVFVEERTKGDLKRNALVSVLLRCLEYYKGTIRDLRMGDYPY
jgi:ATPase family associated with various cellular activities (AAA)